METATTTSATVAQLSPTIHPRFSGMSHVSLPCRDLEESKIFYTQVMGGELVHTISGFVEFRLEDIVIGLSEQADGGSGRDAEYPHYAFYIDGPNFELMKNLLDRYSVPNHPYRRDATAPIYFGGLNYQWNSKNAALGAKQEFHRPRFTAFAHASLYCRDFEQAKRFFTKVIGGELIHEVKDGATGFAEVRVAGVIIGFTDRPGSTTKRDGEYPHYAFFIEPQDFLPMVAWLRQNGVTTSEPWTRDGIKGLLYFRDPSGNLFEMYCPKLKEAATFMRGAKQGGSYAIDFAGLNYQWNG